MLNSIHEEGNGNHLIKSTSLKKTQSPVSGSTNLGIEYAVQNVGVCFYMMVSFSNFSFMKNIEHTNVNLSIIKQFTNGLPE